MLTFTAWLQTTLHNQADLVLPLIQQAGPGGIRLRRLSKFVDLNVNVMAALLDALVGAGVVVSRVDDGELRLGAR